MKLLETQIQIAASPETVWGILTDLEAYADWNPFIVSAKGEVVVGSGLEVTISPPGGKALNFKPKVVSVNENAKFSWLGRVLLPGIFDGEHIFAIEANENGCLFVQKERFSGILVPFFWKGLNTDTRAGFEAMNQALKERAEAV